MSETSPTEQVDTGAGDDTSLPADQNQTPSADEQQPESVSSGDSQDTDQPDDSQPDNSQTTGDDDGSSDDDGLTKFAKSQGIEDLSELSEREQRLLKTAHDNQKAFRTTKQTESDVLKKTLSDTEQVSDDELDELDLSQQEERKRDARLAQLEASQKATDFFLSNPDAREYETAMAELLVKEAKTNGAESARYLAKDLNRVLVLAKASLGDPTEEAKAAGARAERERLRKLREGAGESGQAQQPHKPQPKITRESIAKMDDETYEKLRESGELDAAMARGDLY